MIKVTAMHSGQVPYLVDEAVYDDYLSQSGESPGVWMGRGAERLGLSGQVDAASLTNLLNGLAPDGSRPLIQLSAIRSDRKHAAGWMLTSGDPKSVSLVFGLGDAWTSLQTLEGHQAATAKLVQYVEDNYAFTRRGSGGQRLERCHLIIAVHTHHTNRNAECHLHSHISIVNVVVRMDGTTGTLVSKPLYDHQMELGAVFRAFLAIELRQRTGMELAADGDSFRVVGVPQRLEKALSTRHDEVLAEMAARGTSGAKASEDAALATRKPKENISREILTDRWRRIGESMGFGEAQIRLLVNPHAVRENIPVTPVPAPHALADDKKVVNLRSINRSEQATSSGRQPNSVDSASNRQASNRADSRDAKGESPEVRGFREFVQSFPDRRTRGATQSNDARPGQSTVSSSRTGTGESAQPAPQKPIDDIALKRLIFRAAEADIPKNGIDRLMDHLFDKVQQSRADRKKFQRELGTPEQRQKRLEEILKLGAEAANDRRHFLSSSYVTRQFAKLGGQGEPWRDAAIEVMSLKGAAAVVQTGAGTERETFLRTLRDIYRQAGYKVVGVATTGIAAANMEAATGISTHSTAQFLFRTSPPTTTLLKHHMKEMLHAILNHPTYRFERWSMDRQTVLVVSDAQNLHTPEVKALQDAARAANAKIIFVGDTHRFKAREPANAFDSLAQRLGAVKLAESPRPVETWAQSAIEQVSRGDVNGALSQYAMADRLHLSDSYQLAAAKLIRQWIFVPEQQRGPDTLIVARNVDDANVLNRAAQYARKEKGELGWFLKQRIDGGWVYRNDRVRFSHSSKAIGYRSGDQGTIERIGLDNVTVRLDRSNRIFGFKKPIHVQVPKNRYGDVKLGYALDAFYAQSAFGRMAFVLTDADQRNSSAIRTQLSRATDDTRVFAPRRCVDEEVEQVHDLVQADLLSASINRPMTETRLTSLARVIDGRFPRRANPVTESAKESEQDRNGEDVDVSDSSSTSDSERNQQLEEESTRRSAGPGIRI